MRKQARGCAAAFALAVCASPAWSQEASSPVAESWTTLCTSGGRAEQADCAMEQRLFVEETGRLFSTMIVRVPAATRAAELSITIPLGFQLPSGMQLQIDGADLATLTIRNCDGNGCYADMALSEANLAQLATGGTLSVGLHTLSDERLGFEFPILGFDAAFERIR